MRTRRRTRPEPAHLGIEIDGPVVTGVVVRGTDATAVEHARAGDLTERVAAVLAAAGPVDHVTVAVTGAPVTATPMVLTSPDLDRAAFEAAAYAAVGAPPGTTVVAGLVDTGVPTGHVRSAQVFTAPAALVAAARKAVNRTGAPVMADLACTGPVEGASLVIRYSGAQVTLVRGGRLEAARQLPAGGLTDLDTTLGQGQEVGRTRLEAALTTGWADLSRRDPQAADLLRRYLTLVATQAAATLEEWRLSGHLVPSGVWTHGPGAASDLLGPALRDAGVTPLGCPLAGELATAAPTQRPGAVGAYLAAVAYDPARPQAAFPDPALVEQVTRDAARRARRARTRTAVSALVLAAAAIAAPTVAALADRAGAAADLAAATEQARQVGAVVPTDAAPVPVDAVTAAGRAAGQVGDLRDLHVDGTDLTVVVHTTDTAAAARLDAALTDAGWTVTRTRHHDGQVEAHASWGHR